MDFDLTDIEDIDAISDEFDADPSSDDDTFISNKNKKITKKRQKGYGIIKSINNNNGELKCENVQVIEKYGTIITETTKEAVIPVPTNTIKAIPTTNAPNDDSEDEEKPAEKLVVQVGIFRLQKIAIYFV